MDQVIRLLDSSGENVLDSVSVEYEDSFTLDTLKDLAESHFHSEPTRKFIIARVQTWDPKQPDKSFYSYYNAFHLNKILFQTQMYLGTKLIHRLQVLNPLTNTDIIGHVQYFMCQPREFKDIPIIVEEKGTKIPNPDILKSAPFERRVSIKQTLQPKKSLIQSFKLKIETDFSSELDEIPVSPTVQEVEKKNVVWTLSAPAAVMVTDDYISNLQQPPPNTNKPPRRQTILSPRGGLKQMLSPIIPSNPPKSAPINYAEYADANRAQMQYQAKPILLNDLKHNKIQVPLGTITRFAIPLTADDIKKLGNPSTQTRKRLYSFANAKSAEADISFDAWLDKVSEDNRKSSPQVPLIETNPLFRISETEINHETHQLLFDAILFATDTDFLENNKIRAIFKANAIAPEEAALFEMAPFTGDESTPVRILMDDDFEMECCFPLAAQVEQMPKWKQWVYRRRHFLLATFILLLVVAIALIINVLLKK